MDRLVQLVLPVVVVFALGTVTALPGRDLSVFA